MRWPRSLQIIFAALGFITAWWWWHRRAPEKLPPRLRRSIEHLGTTFIKLAQGLSLRMDLLPAPYREALAELQSRVAPFPGERATAAVEAAFGRPVDQLFQDFEIKPMAAASIAQIHRATLLDGRRVVVKVRRPGIAQQAAHDLRLLRLLIRLASLFWPGLRRQRPLELIAELAAQLQGEMDLRHEARNVRRVAAALREQPTLYVPAVIEPLVSAEVLVQEFAPGRPIASYFGTSEGDALAKALFDAYLHQLFVVGAFHADPHPGNLFAREDGRLCLHDFGLIGTLDAQSRQALARMLEAVVFRDPEAALGAAVEMGFVAGVFDRRVLRRGIDEVLAELQGLPLHEWSIAEAMWRIARLGGGDHLRIPRHLLVLLRTLFLLESTLRALNPQFDLVQELLQRRDTLRTALSAPSTVGLAERPMGEQVVRSVRSVPGLLAQWLAQASADDGRPQVSVHLRGLERLESHLERIGNRLVLAVLAMGLYVGGAVLMLHSVGPRLMGLPVAAIAAFIAAVLLTLKLVVAVGRSDGL